MTAEKKIVIKPWVICSRFFFLVLFIFQISYLSATEYHYAWTPQLRIAFEKIQNLQLNEATRILKKEQSIHPGNLVIPYLEDYIFFYTFFITEDKEGFEKIKDNKQKRLNLLEKGPKNAPEYGQYQAEVLIHWALVRSKFESYLTAAQEVNKAFKLLKKNEKQYPQHMPTRRLLSTIRAGVGTLPKKYKWIVKLLSSLEGSVQEGIDGITSVVEYGNTHPEFIYKDESKMLLAIVLTHFDSDPESAYKMFFDEKTMRDMTPIMRFTAANIAQASGENDRVISLLEDHKISTGSLPLMYLKYMLGVAKLYRNDPDADAPLLYYVNHFKGQHYIKEAYQKLAWHALINGNREGYHRFISYAKKEGNAVVDEDKQALIEAEENLQPNPNLLKARLAFDGGYYISAQKILNSMPTEDLNFGEQLEYDYRLGRVYQEIGAFPKALGAYQKTIQRGENTQYYFACNAALQSGLIYEKLDIINRAKDFYNLCLSMTPGTYQNSLHHKAKLGLNRLKSKK